MTETITDIVELRTRLERKSSIGFVPTMGALHAGHLKLVELAKSQNEFVVVSVFVNPLQFGPNEDLDQYPRQLELDIKQLTLMGVDVCYLPTTDIMYPVGFKTTVSVAELDQHLCGSIRPGHFDGVATVVAKLFNQVQPQRAYFGEKDYQQLCIIKQMVRDLDLPLSIMPVPTVRESDGLAMSSRNQYLSEPERQTAAALYQTLQETAADIKAGTLVSDCLEAAQNTLIEKGFANVDYIALCRADTLEILNTYEPDGRLLAAAFLGQTRLIDNIELG